MSKVVIDRAVVERALRAWDGGDIEWFKWGYAVMEDLRTALAEPVQDAELSAALGWPGGVSTPELDRARLLQMVAALRVSAQQVEPPPEAVTEAEKTAYAAGWWAAMAKGGSNPPPLRAEPKSLPCPTPGACQWHCCGGWCGPRAEAKA